jgi:hypothetical protein
MGAILGAEEGDWSDSAERFEGSKRFRKLGFGRNPCDKETSGILCGHMAVYGVLPE